MQQSFGRIIKLAPDKSDNNGRCNRIERHLQEHVGQYDQAKVSSLDVGAGLAVFPFLMARAATRLQHWTRILILWRI